MLNSLGNDELNALSLNDLVTRMDKVLEANRVERYGASVLKRPFNNFQPSVKKICCHIVGIQ